MSYLDRLLALTTSAETLPSKPSEAPSEPFEGKLPGQIHPVLLAAVVRLETMVRPAPCELRAWRQMVKDARGLVEAGWGDKALALGWSEVDLFGIAKDQDGSLGLAAWLQGHVITAMSDTWAVVRLPGDCRRYFNRPVPGAVLPWEIAR